MNTQAKHLSAVWPAGMVKRLFWLGLVALHVSAIASLAADLPASAADTRVIAIFRLVALCTSVGFFILKIVDVPWLRLRSGWRSIVTFTIVIALIHVGAIDNAIAGELHVSPYEVGLVLFLGGLSQVESLRRLRRLVLVAMTPLRMLRLPPCAIRLDRDWQCAPRRTELAYIPAFSGLRAPPIR